MKYHLIGIGGAGMSVVAELLVNRGHEVCGSDREDSAVLQHLETLGVKTFLGHAAENLAADAIVVRSSAIKGDNPELALALERGQQVLHRSEALALASAGLDFIAVAGAHGKTSTTGILATAFGALGLDPSRAIGGSLAGGISGAYLGTGTMLVAEADESDGSFLNYSPRVALVTNIEADHLDHYGSYENFANAFLDFSHRIVPGGLLVTCADDAGARKLAEAAAAAGIRVVTYGYTPGIIGIPHALLTETPNLSGNCATVEFAGNEYQLKLNVPGEHMLLNAAGAWVVGQELGVDPEAMAAALGAFKGTSRRFEFHGEACGIRVYDDYAHHPTEILATLKTAREISTGRVLVLFQPHLYSRTKNFKDRFAQALSLADEVVIAGAYAAREVPTDGEDGDVIAELLPGSMFVADLHQAARALLSKAREGDTIFTIGAGNVTTMAPEILRILETR
ncbi:MAG: UDP-N-acetylmuramate--L-alanine ligase [Arcanobacterium sp.]|nr:UDP-N-acetylmuramate--L-alanine ligase [Arcanobacterium sp.]